MTIPDFLQRLRNPKETAKTAIVAITLATLSIIGTQMATGLYNVANARLDFPMIRAEIESLRGDLEHVPCSAIPMIVSQAADWNRRIEHEKESRRHWWSKWAVPLGWDSVGRLRIPCDNESSISERRLPRSSS